jgi:hypothetical protein
MDRPLTLGTRLPRLTSEQLLWIDITGRDPEELTRVGRLLDLHHACVGDLQFDLTSLVSDDRQIDRPLDPPHTCHRLWPGKLA